MGLKFPSLLYENRQNNACKEDDENFATIRDSASTFVQQQKSMINLR